MARLAPLRRAALVVLVAFVLAAPAAAGPGVPGVDDPFWLRLAACESGGRPHLDTGNGFHGALQFHPDTWRRAGGGQYAPTADGATLAEQIAVGHAWAQRVAPGSTAGWPVCWWVAMGGEGAPAPVATPTEARPRLTG